MTFRVDCKFENMSGASRVKEHMDDARAERSQ
jgi:hypothetical protein